MKIKIFKYPLAIESIQVIQIPMNFQCLAIQVQHGVPVMWAEVNEQNPTFDCTVLTYGTGQEFEKGEHDVFAGTYQVSGGVYVVHVYLRAPGVETP